MSPLLRVEDLTVGFPAPEGSVRAVSSLDLAVDAGEFIGIVGESGSGKSVTLRSILGLTRPPATVTGRVEWQGVDLLTLSESRRRRIRGRQIAMIFQEPMSALNPVLTVGAQIDESLRVHTRLDRRQRRARAVELLDLVGIPAAADRLKAYPHQFSGGMRQRAMIAIALAAEPALLLADEPTTALDVTIQDQILRLLMDLRDRLGMAVVLVTHDLGVVAQCCDRVAVMYAGRLVETGAVGEVLTHPHHPYTEGLLNSIPRPGFHRRRLRSIEGSPPSLSQVPPGCAFHPRCHYRTEQCTTERPELSSATGRTSPDQLAACFHQDKVGAHGLVATG